MKSEELILRTRYPYVSAPIYYGASFTAIATPFNSEEAYSALSEFVDAYGCPGYYGLSPVDYSVTFAYSGTNFAAVRYGPHPPTPRAAAIAEWLNTGKIAAAGRAMVDPGRRRDPLEVEEFEDYLDDITTHISDRHEIVARRRVDRPMWWFSTRSRVIVHA